MAAQADAGLLKDITDDDRAWTDTINPGALSIYQYDGKQYGVPWDVGIDRLLVQQGPVRAGRDHRPADDVGRAARRRRQAQGRRDHPDALAGKDKWPGMLLWTYLVLRIGGPTAAADDPERQLEHRRLQAGRRRGPEARRHEAVPGGLPGRRL